MNLIRPLFAALITALAAAAASASIIIDNFTTATNDRFANNGSFILDGFNLSGLGRSSDGKWGTLVSNNVFLSANHSRPAVGAALMFFETNDPNGNSVTRTVSSGQRVGSSDLWIGVLDSPVSSAYASFSLVTNDIADAGTFDVSVFDGALAYIVGRSPTNWANSLHDVVVGTNILDVWAEDSSAAGTTDDAIAAIYQLGANDLTYEALLQGGDSGGPMFVTDGSNLFLAGINWWGGRRQCDRG